MCVTRDNLPGPLYLRFTPGADGRWQVTELYLEARDGAAITGSDLRTLPLAAVVGAMVIAGREHLESRAGLAGPDLGTLASNYATTFGPRAQHWVADSMRDPDGNRRLRKQPPASPVPAPEVPPLRRPARIDDAFLRHVADAYASAIRHEMRAPAVYLSGQAFVSVQTVRRWIYLARKRGFLPPGSPGRIG
jgi:hypothetical protein